MNLFLVTSPFQYMCANEARVQYQTINNILLIVKQNSHIATNQQNNVIDVKKWDHVISIPRTSRTKYMPYVVKKIQALLGYKPLNYFFHGEYNGWRTKILLKNLLPLNEVYFDDGTLTISEYEEFIRNKSIYNRKRFFNDLFLRLQGIKHIGSLAQSENLEIFTIFDLINPVHVVKKNNFINLQSSYQNFALYDKTAPIGFIGEGSIGHKNRKPPEIYVQELEQFFAKQKNGIIYFPHRTESAVVKQMLQKIDNLTYHDSKFPLEMELLKKQIKLSGLVGTLSTAQYSIKLLAPDMPIYTIKTDQSVLSELEQTRSKRIEILYDKAGISEIFL